MGLQLKFCENEFDPVASCCGEDPHAFLTKQRRWETVSKPNNLQRALFLLQYPYIILLVPSYLKDYSYFFPFSPNTV